MGYYDVITSGDFRFVQREFNRLDVFPIFDKREVSRDELAWQLRNDSLTTSEILSRAQFAA